MVKRCLAVLWILMIAGCNTTTLSDSETRSERAQSSEPQAESAESTPVAEAPATVESKPPEALPSSSSAQPPEGEHSAQDHSAAVSLTDGSDTTKDSQVISEQSASEQPASEQAISGKSASGKSASGQSIPVQPESEPSRPTNAKDPAPSKGVSSKDAETTVSQEPAETAPEIKIDETVCGSGGHEAYFETRRREIYICRNENATLTYIATPKKKQSNSVFLPATAVPDGDKTAYIAQDGTSVVVVGPFGYRREENGKAIAKEKVIRNR